MPFQIQRRFTLFDGSSGESSTYTSTAQYVGDYAYMSVSWATDIAAASTLTLQGSNDDGFSAAIVNWSTVSAIKAPGLYTVDPGFRWLRGQRRSNESLSQVEMYGRT
jgi:hypothetical protein